MTDSLNLTSSTTDLSTSDIHRWKEVSRGSERNLYFEAMRGVASIVVLLYHTTIAFSPSLAAWLYGSPLFVLINGDAAVTLFFVLSGYVLTRRYFVTGDSSVLVRGAVKRWPRLMLPALASVLVSYAFFRLGFYFYSEAGSASGSQWLRTFAGGERPYPAALSNAVFQGSIRVFFIGDDNSFNTNLWTMFYEMYGSLICFIVAPLLFRIREKSTVLLISCLIFLVAVIQAICMSPIGRMLPHSSSPHLLGFILGGGAAAILSSEHSLANGARAVICLIAMILLSVPSSIPMPYFGNYPAIVATVLLLIAFEGLPSSKTTAIAVTARWLGVLSFPIYLTHIIAIASIGSFFFLRSGATAAITMTLAGTLVLSLPLSFLNERWLRLLNKTFGHSAFPRDKLGVADVSPNKATVKKRHNSS